MRSSLHPSGPALSAARDTFVHVKTNNAPLAKNARERTKRRAAAEEGDSLSLSLSLSRALRVGGNEVQRLRNCMHAARGLHFLCEKIVCAFILFTIFNAPIILIFHTYSSCLALEYLLLCTLNKLRFSTISSLSSIFEYF